MVDPPSSSFTTAPVFSPDFGGWDPSVPLNFFGDLSSDGINMSAHQQQISTLTSSGTDSTDGIDQLPAPPSPTNTRINTCQCLPSTLLILEEFTVASIRSSLKTVALDLHLNKRAINMCWNHMACYACSSNSSLMNLLITLCQKVAVSYESLIRTLEIQFNKLHPPGGPAPVPMVERDIWFGSDEGGLKKAMVPGGAKIVLNEYEVDIEEEPCVFGGAATMQLKKFRTFLIKFKELMRERVWIEHAVAVDMVEEQVKAVLWTCGRCSREEDDLVVYS